MSRETARNVIIFGETGAGKSSVVNMIIGSDQATVSGDATRCTFDSTRFATEIAGKSYNLFDTTGFGDFTYDSMDIFKTIQTLHKFLTDLSKDGGIHLLVFVVRCGRLTQTVHKNYALFHQGFCDAQVPIVVIVTGCEDVEPRMVEWWTRNESFFTRAGMSFEDYACVCAFKGRSTPLGYANEDLVDESTELVEKLIAQHCKSVGWKKESNSWFRTISHLFKQLAPDPRSARMASSPLQGGSSHLSPPSQQSTKN
ncbi:P-loop containing nucleoside triphosphate hydrolase protein [Gymnopilus junonius]|uniref:P-loop containing nucleoside triphosphate hydrolase protein n=1 Tax=Gymnopilus junonius TaxID=109634 RepID=A0A9P5NC41_GYMJU|nr:P-loop containing nucleoside triphosphate hydrolase protein [Gymnopilus junonius]